MAKKAAVGVPTEVAGRPYLTIDNSDFDTRKVDIGYMEITAVPQTSAYVKGVINLRGQVIPVVDLRAKFGMEATEVTEETCCACQAGIGPPHY